MIYTLDARQKVLYDLESELSVEAVRGHTIVLKRAISAAKEAGLFGIIPMQEVEKKLQWYETRISQLDRMCNNDR